MSKRKRYSLEYRQELVDLARRSTSSCRKIALEVGVAPALLTRCVREAESGGTKAFPGAISIVKGLVRRIELGTADTPGLLQPQRRLKQLFLADGGEIRQKAG